MYIVYSLSLPECVQNVLCDPYQSHAPEDGDPVHGLQAEVEEARNHDCQVKDVPAVPEILCSPQGRLSAKNTPIF